MDIRHPTRFRPTAATAHRFVSDLSPTSAEVADEDLTEDDIFSFVDYSSRSHNQLSSSPSFPSSRHRGAPSSSAFSPPEASFGILAALPKNDPRHIFNHKAASVAYSASSTSAVSLSPSSISASRVIPLVPKPPPPLNERFLGKYYQSAPVSVPVLANLRRRGGGFLGDEYDEVEEEEEDENEMLRPPHEIVARRSERVACSVLEGAGRTLKGRDLRRVRNAVWRQTGIGVLVKCDKVKKLSVATTSRTGFFQAELPKDNIVPQSSDQPADCFARVFGSPTQVYASEKDMVSKVVEARHKTSLIYMTSTPLAISTTRPSSDKTDGRMKFGSSKTIDLPVPREWGLPPTSYYTPFIPIIGIP